MQDPYVGIPGPGDIGIEQDYNQDRNDGKNDKVKKEEEERVREIQEDLNIDYYVILNVDKSSSLEDIKSSYKKLCLLYHPDKHIDPDSKDAAEHRFESIQTAYQILSDDSRRYIYDHYGSKAASESWTVSLRGKSIDEIKKEYERRNNMEFNENNIDNYVKSKGDIQINVDATNIFRKIRNLPIPNTIKYKQINPRLYQSSVKHSWDTQLTDSSTFTVQGVVVAKNGSGAGSVTGTIKSILSPLCFTEFSSTFGQSPNFIARLYRAFPDGVFTNFTAVSTNVSNPPILNAVIGKPITKSTVGFINLRTGVWSIGSWGKNVSVYDLPTCSLGLNHTSKSTLSSSNIQIGKINNSFEISQERKLYDGLTFKIGLQLSTMTGMKIGFDTLRVITKYTKIGIGCDYNLISGHSLKLRFIRLKQRFSIPILISPNWDTKIMVGLTLTPPIIIYLLEKLWFKPNNEKSIKNKIKKIRIENKDKIIEKRKEAIESIKLHSDSVISKFSNLIENGKLVIIYAEYGNIQKIKELPSSDIIKNSIDIKELYNSNYISKLIQLEKRKRIKAPIIGMRLQSLSNEIQVPIQDPDKLNDNDLQPGLIDVVIPLQSLINSSSSSFSQLLINSGFSKSQLYGFWDPCIGERKHLRITYLFNGQLHFVEIDDKESLAIPQRSHII